MRFAHMADIHFDSPFRILALKASKKDKKIMYKISVLLSLI